MWTDILEKILFSDLLLVCFVLAMGMMYIDSDKAFVRLQALLSLLVFIAIATGIILIWKG